jgi:hypothetical protein
VDAAQGRVGQPVRIAGLACLDNAHIAPPQACDERDITSIKPHH